MMLIQRLAEEHKICKVLKQFHFVGGERIPIFLSSYKTFRFSLLPRCQMAHPNMVWLEWLTVYDSIFYVP